MLLRLDAFDAERLPADRIAIGIRRRFVRNIELVELLAAAGDETGFELLAASRAKHGLHGPILAGLEGFDLRLAVDHKAKRHHCTRPAKRAPGNLRQSTGDSVKPTR